MGVALLPGAGGLGILPGSSHLRPLTVGLGEAEFLLGTVLLDGGTCTVFCLLQWEKEKSVNIRMYGLNLKAEGALI